MPVYRREDTNVLFVHVPKTGGTTIERVFRTAGFKEHYRDSKVGQGTLNRLRLCSPQHMHTALLQGLFHLDRFDVVFMVVRDPIARFRSEFAMRHKADVPLEEHRVERWADKVFSTYARNPYTLDNHLRPQSEFYLPGATVFRLEDGLEKATAHLNQHFGLGLPAELPRVMDREKGSGVPSRSVPITTDLEARLRAFYCEDFAQFGY
ncbi:MAG TPA: sulfotransferase family 2 domain-containing protein [Nocardioidaceae bacterium]|nr:sulfotransferase family 2 domain-containing protein [Nocardioidaceae bacterium]